MGRRTKRKQKRARENAAEAVEKAMKNLSETRPAEAVFFVDSQGDLRQKLRGNLESKKAVPLVLPAPRAGEVAPAARVKQAESANVKPESDVSSGPATNGDAVSRRTAKARKRCKISACVCVPNARMFPNSLFSLTLLACLNGRTW